MGVTAFNTAFAQDGVLFYVPKNVVVEKPIQLVNILRGDVNFMVNRRVLVVLEEGAQARLLICDHAMDNVNSFLLRLLRSLQKKMLLSIFMNWKKPIPAQCVSVTSM